MIDIKEVNAIEICPHEGKIRLIKITEGPRDTCVGHYKHKVFAEFEYGNWAYGITRFGFARYDVRPLEVKDDVSV